jgi:hypothetical protein
VRSDSLSSAHRFCLRTPVIHKRYFGLVSLSWFSLAVCEPHDFKAAFASRGLGFRVGGVGADARYVVYRLDLNTKP